MALKCCVFVFASFVNYRSATSPLNHTSQRVVCGLMRGDVILVSIAFLLYFSAAILCITMYFVFFSFFLCLSLFVSLPVSFFDGQL